MTEQKRPTSRREDIVVQELFGEVLIYDLKADKAFCLNKTSAMVWQHCDGTKFIGEKTDASVSEELIWLALDQLKKENLLSDETEIVSNFKAMSRREAIRKAGLASMIALPVISSLVAPTAAAAQSEICTPIGDVCDGITPCCSGGVCVEVSGVFLCGVIIP
jgi:hypothetical protein